MNLNSKYTRKNAQVVTNLQQTCSNAVPTTCQQDVFALLVPKLTSCYKVVELNRLVTIDLFQQLVNKFVMTIDIYLHRIFNSNASSNHLLLTVLILELIAVVIFTDYMVC
jgi:hypothetical protein